MLFLYFHPEMSSRLSAFDHHFSDFKAETIKNLKLHNMQLKPFVSLGILHGMGIVGIELFLRSLGKLQRLLNRTKCIFIAPKLRKKRILGTVVVLMEEILHHLRCIKPW